MSKVACSDSAAALKTMRANPQALTAADRCALVNSIAEAILCQSVGDDTVVSELLDLLARDADWSVRLEVAKVLHLFDDALCGRLAAVLRQDCNTYVRSHTQRGVGRQRKTRHTAKRRRDQRQGYGDQIDELARRHGKQVADRVRTLADQRYAMLAQAVAHDVRSILTTLTSNAAALARQDGANGRAGSIVEDVEMLRRTVDAMEQFSKPLPEQRHPESLPQMIQQAIEKARAGLAAEGHDCAAVKVVVNEVPNVRLRVSRRLIVLALTNVLENALESFADREVDALAPGKIEVEASVDGYETQIIVRDNGPGAEPQVLAEIAGFMPSGPNKAKRSSSGWGLSLVHKYITAHSGTVRIDSELDRGTTVVMRLPMRESSVGDHE